MGLAAIFMGALIALALLVAVAYGMYIGLARAGLWLWRLLLGEVAEADAEVSAASVPCWEEKQCSTSLREVCPAYIRSDDDLPCWLTNLRAEGKLRVECLTCHRFSVAELVA